VFLFKVLTQTLIVIDVPFPGNPCEYPRMIYISRN